MLEHLKIKSNYDNLPLDTLIMSPSHPKAILQISHGMCEHKERYMHFMNYLNNHGYLCIIHDHRGHGKSILNNNDLGYFYNDGNIAIVEDLHQITLFIKERYPQLPVYLLGHSMGSLVARCYTKKYDDEINGLILSGSPSLNKAAPLAIKLTEMYSKIKDDHYRPKLIAKIGIESFNKNFNHKIENSWVCSDPEVVKAYNVDPLCHYTFTNNGFHALFSLMVETYSKDNWELKNKDLPICFLAGKKDPCIINEKKFFEAVRFIQQRGYKTSYKLFDNMQHEILNENKKIIVYKTILKLLNTWQNHID